MMTSLHIPKIEAKDIAIQDLSGLLHKERVPAHRISVANWEEYPYKPSVEFRIAHNDGEMFLSFRVQENHVKARYTEDNSAVWEDSCVEFFISFDGNDTYYNIECNCIGALLMSTGVDRNDRSPASLDILEQIRRLSSLGNLPVDIQQENIEWELSLAIPKQVFFLHKISKFSKHRAKGNFYKCGDGLITPHFLSWKPIENKTPNFHLPLFFGEILFD